MKPLSIFGDLNIKLSDRFWKKVTDAVAIYSIVWLIIQIIFWIVIGFFDLIQGIFFMGTSAYDTSIGTIPPNSMGTINLKPLISGFTLFQYLPYWLRIILLIFIAIAVISIPFAVLAFLSFSDSGSQVDSYARDELKINCVECNREISPQGEWLTGETDIRCRKCGAIMTLAIENGRFKKLTLKRASEYPPNLINRF